MASLDASLDIMDETCNIYPVWLCPMRVPKTPYRSMVEAQGDDDMFVDVGVYGVPMSKSFKARETVRKIESFVRECKGFQALYAETLMTYEEMCAMFPSELYFKARNKFPETVKAFPEVYEKISSVARESDPKQK